MARNRRANKISPRVSRLGGSILYMQEIAAAISDIAEVATLTHYHRSNTTAIDSIYGMTVK